MHVVKIRNLCTLRRMEVALTSDFIEKYVTIII